MENMVKFTTAGPLEALNNGEEEEAVSFADNQVQAISQAAAGHPLLATRAVSYLLTDLIEQYDVSAIDKFIHDASTAD